jgi:hypothetical protein
MSGYSDYVNKISTAGIAKPTQSSGYSNYKLSLQGQYKPEPAKPVVAPATNSNLPNFPALNAASHPTYKQIMAANPTPGAHIGKMPKLTATQQHDADVQAAGKVPNVFEQWRIDLKGTPAEKKKLALQMEYATTPQSTTAPQAAMAGAINDFGVGNIAKAITGNDTYQKSLETAQRLHPLAYGAGSIAGYIAPGSLVDKGVSTLARPLLEKAGTTIAGKIASRAATAAASNAALVAASDKLQGASNSQTAKDAAIQGLVGGILGGSISAIGARSAIKTATRELRAKGLITPASKIPSNIAKATEDRAVANAAKTFGTTGEHTYSPTAPMGAPVPKVVLTETDLKKLYSNPVYDEAAKEYNDAIEKIHNHFQVNELTPAEEAQIKPVLGIDLPAIVDKLDAAEALNKMTPEDRLHALDTYGVMDYYYPQEIAKYRELNASAPSADSTLSKASNIVAQGETAATNVGDGLGAKSLTPQRTQALLADEAGKKTYIVNNFEKSPNVGGNNNKIAQGVIDRTSSEENANKLQTNLFSKDVLKTVPKIEDRQAATIYAEMPKEEISAALQGKDAQIYDGENLLKQLESEPKTPETQQKIADVQSLLSQLNKRIPENLKNLDRVQNIDGVMTTPRKLLVAAQNLKGETQLTAQNATDFTGQIGAFSKERGTLDGTVPNYLKHEYNQPDINNVDTKTLAANRQTALQNKISLKLSNGTGTNINSERVYKNYITAMLHGENPKTLDLARLVSKTGNEMAHKNAVAGMLNDLAKNDISVVGKRVFDGYKEVGQGADGLKIQLPKQLAKALTPVLDENYGKGYGGKVWTDVMNKVKSIKLGFSLFHYKNLAVAAANDGDFKPIIDTIKNIPHMQEYMRSAEFRDTQLDLVKHTGMTSAVESNMDTGRGLNPSETTVGRLFDQIGKLPAFKQAGQIMDANNKVLFEDMQSVYKVQGYAVKVSAWAADHKGATMEELDAAKNSIARHINGVFGGLNWKSLRVPKKLLGTMRMLMLAPDWTTSNVDVARTAFNVFNHSAGAGEARKFWVRNVILGFATLESANIAFTGHGTWMNPKGHELNVEVSPGVYATTLDGLMKDAATIIGDVTKSGSGGVTQFGLSKLNPIASTVFGLAKQTDFYGRSLIDKNGNPLKTTANEASFAAQQLVPIPFGATGLYNYAKDPNAKKSALGVGLIGTGLGSYSSDAKVNPSEPQAGNWMYNLTPQGRTDAAATNSIKAFKTQSTANNTALKAEIAKGNKYAGQLAQKYGKTVKEVQSEIAASKKPPIKGVYYGGRQVSISGDTKKYPTLLSSYASLSAANQKTQYNKMTIGQRQLLNTQIKALIGK